MKLPRSLHGKYREVNSRMSKMVTQLKRGMPLGEAIQAEDLIDTAEVEGLLVLHGPYPSDGFEPHFHCFAPVRAIDSAMVRKRLPWSLKEDVFLALLEHPWGVLGLLDHNHWSWVEPAARYRPFMRAVLRDWDLLLAEGERFTPTFFNPQGGGPLWTLSTNIQYVLCHLGVPLELVRHSMHLGPAALLAEAGIPL